MIEAEFEEIRHIQYEILKSTAAYCDSHNLRYILTGGTLLGAVRHQGFIPWDDDIDIAMPRPDYEKLIAKSGGHLDSYYDLNVFENNPYHARLFMRIVDNRTVYLHEYYEKKYASGLGIDVFPVDGVPVEPKIQADYFRKIRYYKKLFALSQSALWKSTNPVKALGKTMISIPAHIVGRSHYYKKILTLVEQYPFDQCDMAGITIGVYLEKEICIKSQLFETTELTFEDRKFHAPICYDKYLRQLYGDYMILPPKKNRVRGHSFKVYLKESIKY